MELKLPPAQLEAGGGEAFNRTIVELKLRKQVELFARPCTFNRTIVELKPYEMRRERDTDLAFNRTIVELKRQISGTQSALASGF